MSEQVLFAPVVDVTLVTIHNENGERLGILRYEDSAGAWFASLEDGFEFDARDLNRIRAELEGLNAISLANVLSRYEALGFSASKS